MTTYPLIYNGLIVETAPDPFPVASALVWGGDISGLTPEPQVGWTATESAGTWTFTAPPAPPVASLAQQAQAALDESDTTMHRIAEGVSLGLTTWTAADVVAWVTYRRALRVLLTADTGTLPAKPAYPAGS